MGQITDRLSVLRRMREDEENETKSSCFCCYQPKPDRLIVRILKAILKELEK